ncbi:MAG: dienelactone hydrolase family protein [Dehalococcoidia bacterium]
MTPRPPAVAHLALSPTGRGPGVLVIHAWWGLNTFLKGLCDRLAVEGFVAAAPDLYDGKVAVTIEEAERLRTVRRKEPVYRTLIRALEVLGEHPGVTGERLGVIGFSMGGHWALWLAQRPDLPVAAAVTFYGARGGDYSRSRAAFQGHFAQHDKWNPEAAIRRLGRALAGQDAEIYQYPNTDHWFFEADRPDAYDQAAAELAWQRTVAFLRRQLIR